MTLLTRKEAMQLLNIGKDLFNDLQNAGKIQPSKIVGKSKRYDKEEILTSKLYL
jgi:hypothetical protein